MYKTDTRAKKMIKTLAGDIVSGGFRVKVTNDPAAQQAADDLLQRLHLSSAIEGWIRLTVRDGDSFLEIGVNDRMQIADVTRKPTLQMHRNSDDADRFPDPTQAYWWADSIWIGQEAPRDAVWFADWQIIHARWDHDEGDRYGTPMFASGTGAWKRVTEGEVDVAIRRKTRAGMKYLHVVEGADEGGLKKYKELNKAALDNPFAAVADFFTNKKGAIMAIQGDATLSEIGDVEHHIATWMMSGDVPMELLGYGENLNRDVLKEKKREYDETLQQLRTWAEGQIVRPLLETQWLLAGIWPERLEYEIKWQAKQVLTAQDLKDVADAALRLRTLGWPDEVIASVLERFIPGVDLSFMLQQDRDEEEGAPGQVANAADEMRSRIGG
jgi:hypothetical protein